MSVTFQLPTWLAVLACAAIIVDSIAGVYCTILMRREDRRRRPFVG